MKVGSHKLSQKAMTPFSRLRSEKGYLLIIVTLIGLVLAVIFGNILPQLHVGQQVRGVNTLNEYRAYEAARKGVDAVRLGLKDVDNLLEVMGYPITKVKTGKREFTIPGQYADRFPAGSRFSVYYSKRNDGVYTVASASTTEKGPTTIEVYEHIPNNSAKGLISNNRGIPWAIDQLAGATTSSSKRDEYLSKDGEVQFISGSLGIDLGGGEAGRLQIMIIVARNDQIHDTSDGDKMNEGWYFYNDGLAGPDGGPWLSPDNWSGGTVKTFQYKAGSLGYYDFDLRDTLGSTNYRTYADLKYERTVGGPWSLAIGYNGSWRSEYGGHQLWNLRKSISSGERPFKNRDNDGDGERGGENDQVEVFVIVRSVGITAAPGPDYDKDKTDLRPINDATNGALPNPMPQVLEAGFYLTDANNDGRVEVRRFYYAQPHNLED